ncbi:hypothetical protein [Saccharothrix sp. Mg75]|uniref:hypothetical protein n=1 Tax=Saccharothrix sp. Mg75 TaxID=3445357 RepID=UPI003EEA6B88
MSLELADQVASVTSAVLGAAGLACALVGLVLQWRDRRRARVAALFTDPVVPDAPAPEAPTAESTGLYVPSRNEWVPDPSNLPQGGYGNAPWDAGHGFPDVGELSTFPPSFPQQAPVPGGRGPAGRALLVVGASLLALCAVAAAVSLAL